MNTTTKAVSAWGAEATKAFYVRQVLKSIRDCREAVTDSTADDRSSHAHGMISAGLFLDALTQDEYDRLWDLASNAWHYRFHELLHGISPHTWKPTPAAQEARP